MLHINESDVSIIAEAISFYGKAEPEKGMIAEKALSNMAASHRQAAQMLRDSAEMMQNAEAIMKVQTALIWISTAFQ